MSHIDRRLLTSLVGGAAIASVCGGVTWAALVRPAEKWPHGSTWHPAVPYGTWPNVSAEEWEIEKALLRGDYIEVASAR